MRKLIKLGTDFIGLMRVCGLAVALKWMFHVLGHLPAILRSGVLMPADLSMGEGPFEVRLKNYNARFKVKGPQSMTGIREMYVGDVYLRNGWLTIKPNDVVVDLGANIGNFTNMALAVDPSVRVIAVEPSSELNRTFTDSVSLNQGHIGRTTLVRAFLGQSTSIQDGVLSRREYADAEWMSGEQLLERAHIDHIDFLKCDIEGSEFGLLTKETKILAVTKALACEVHECGGDMDQFLSEIEESGFVIGPIQRARGSLIVLAKRPA